MGLIVSPAKVGVLNVCTHVKLLNQSLAHTDIPFSLPRVLYELTDSILCCLLLPEIPPPPLPDGPEPSSDSQPLWNEHL